MTIDNWILYKRYDTKFLIYLLIGNLLFWSGLVSVGVDLIGWAEKDVSPINFMAGLVMLVGSLFYELYLERQAGIKLRLI